VAAFTYQSAYDGAVADANLGHRVQVASVRAALDIWTAQSGAANKQTALCTAVTLNPAQYMVTWLLVCGTDPTIVAGGVSPTDAEILAAIKNAWPTVAGN
jgi:hypothetical protein